MTRENDDPLPPPDGTTTPRGKIVCEFCESSLSANGDALKLGGKAKAYRDSDRTIESLNDQIGARDLEIAALKTEIETLKAAKPADTAPARGSGGWLSGSRG